MDCIFCKIMNNEIPSYTIYEDDILKVIMDINPVSNGHMLIIPKKHILNITDMDSDTLTHINNVAKDMYKLLKDKLNIDGLTITINNEYGQDVKHFHMHLIPRYTNDELFFRHNSDTDVKDIYNKLKELITN